jgi:hypothetical protein
MCLKTVDGESEFKVIIPNEMTVIIGKAENRTQSTASEEFAADLNSESIFKCAIGRTISKGLLVADAYKGGKCQTRSAIGNLWWLANSTCRGKSDLSINFHAGRLVTKVIYQVNFSFKVVVLKAARDIQLSDFVSGDSFLQSIGIKIHSLLGPGNFLTLPVEWCYDSGIFSRVQQSEEWKECGCYTGGDHSGNER